MKKYNLYTVEELILDESFVDWVIHKDPAATIFWEQWLTEYPQRHPTVEQAQQLLLGIYNLQNTEDVPAEWIQADVPKVLSKIQTSAEDSPTSLYIGRRRWLAVAASIALLVAAKIWFFNKEKTSSAMGAYQALVQSNTIQLVEKKNDLDETASVLLPDGSVVYLEKGARVSYPAAFQKDNRTVYLVGEAFFEVVKDAKKPFLVYANATVTKVLGTSFKILAQDESNDVVVSVKTGKVMVYKQKDFDLLKNARNTEGGKESNVVLLIPNQQAVLNKNSETIKKTLVDNPTALAPQPASQIMNFDDVPIAKVLKSLQKMYGIDIVFDEETLNKCPFTGTFEEENLNERLDVICHSIQASYEIVEGQIVFTGVCK